MKFAARHQDLVSCLKHGAGVIEAPLDRNVLINHRPAAVLGDPCSCVPGGDPNQVAPLFEAPNKITAGMADILVNGRPLAALGHNTVHDLGGPAAPTGAVVTCTWDVWVGGNTQIGDAEAARLACLELAASRKGTRGVQSYNNCGPETTRLLVNGTKTRKKDGKAYVDEDTWLDQQIRNGDAQLDVKGKELDEMSAFTKDELKAVTDLEVTMPLDERQRTPEQKAALEEANAKLRRKQGEYKLALSKRDRGARLASGGSDSVERDRQLRGTPAEAELLPATMDTAMAGVAHGQGVIVPVANTPLKPGQKDQFGLEANTALGHIVVVTAVVVDENGKPVKVVYNDTFNACGMEMPADEFAGKIQPKTMANVTKKPVW